MSKQPTAAKRLETASAGLDKLGQERAALNERKAQLESDLADLRANLQALQREMYIGGVDVSSGLEACKASIAAASGELAAVANELAGNAENRRAVEQFMARTRLDVAADELRTLAERGRVIEDSYKWALVELFDQSVALDDLHAQYRILRAELERGGLASPVPSPFALVQPAEIARLLSLPDRAAAKAAIRKQTGL